MGQRRAVLTGRQAGQSPQSQCGPSTLWAGLQGSPNLTDKAAEAQGAVGSGSMASFVFHFCLLLRQFLNCLLSSVLGF